MKLEVIKDLHMSIPEWYDTVSMAWKPVPPLSGFKTLLWTVGEIITVLRDFEVSVSTNVGVPSSVISTLGVLNTAGLLYLVAADDLIPISYDNYHKMLRDGHAKKVKTPKQFIPFKQDQEIKDLDFLSKPKYTSICPHCGGPAFEIFSTVECNNGCHLKGVDNEN